MWQIDLETNFLEKNLPSRKDLRGSDKIPRMKKTHDEAGKLTKSKTLIDAKTQQNATKKWERSPRQRHCARSYSVRRTDARKKSKMGGWVDSLEPFAPR